VGGTKAGAVAWVDPCNPGKYLVRARRKRAEGIAGVRGGCSGLWGGVHSTQKPAPCRRSVPCRTKLVHSFLAAPRATPGRRDGRTVSVQLSRRAFCRLRGSTGLAALSGGKAGSGVPRGRRRPTHNRKSEVSALLLPSSSCRANESLNHGLHSRGIRGADAALSPVLLTIGGARWSPHRGGLKSGGSEHARRD